MKFKPKLSIKRTAVFFISKGTEWQVKL